MVILSNSIVGSYDRKLRTAQRDQLDMATLKKSLEAEKEKSSGLPKEVAALKLENHQFGNEVIETKGLLAELYDEKTALTVKLSSETQRLMNSREECVRRERREVRKEKASKYAARFDKVKKYLVETKEANTALRTLSQITGTLDCLNVLMEKGAYFPSAELERLAADKEKCEAKLDTMEVTDLLKADLASFYVPETFLLSYFLVLTNSARPLKRSI